MRRCKYKCWCHGRKSIFKSDKKSWLIQSFLNNGLKLLLLFLSLGASINDGQAQCSGGGCTYYINGADASTYDVFLGQTICLDVNANFTGTINLDGGTLNNCATATQTFTLTTSSSFPTGVVNNYGDISFPATIILKDGITVNNYNLFSAGGNLEVRSGATFNNADTTTVAVDLVVQNNFINSGYIDVVGDVTSSSSGIITNSGELYANYFTTNNVWTNSGTITIATTFNTNSTSLGTINGGCITCEDFVNRSTITGTTCGDIIVNSFSQNQSSGSLLGDIGFIDLTPPGSAPYIDSNGGTIGPGVVWYSCAGCIPEICNNSIDDDGDGDIDCADVDCVCCEAVAPTLTKQ